MQGLLEGKGEMKEWRKEGYMWCERLSVWGVSGVCVGSGKEGKSDLVRWEGEKRWLAVR